MPETDANWYSNDAATLGDRIAAAREAQGLTQKTLAKKLGVALKTIDGWEHDTAEPRANRLQMLAGVLGVSIPWLLTGEGQGVTTSPVDDDGVEYTELAAEMGVLRAEMHRAAERLGRLEKRLKAAIAREAV